MYLSGQTLRSIKEALESGGFKNSAGTTEWTTSNLRTILSDEKYCGDVLLQKTFIQDCISKRLSKIPDSFPCI
ncbi:MAG: recombinase family protein [Dysosmobacter sp.]